MLIRTHTSHGIVAPTENFSDVKLTVQGIITCFADLRASHLSDIYDLKPATGTFLIGDGSKWTARSIAGTDLPTHSHTATDQGGDYPWADITGFAGSGTATTVAHSDHLHAGVYEPAFGHGTMATQNANAVNIDGGSLDGTTIGAASRAAGTFTYLTVVPPSAQGSYYETGKLWNGVRVAGWGVKLGLHCVDNNWGEQTYGAIGVKVVSNTVGAFSGRLVFEAANSGSLVTVATMLNTGSLLTEGLHVGSAASGSDPGAGNLEVDGTGTFGGHLHAHGGFSLTAPIEFLGNDTTPSVSGGNIFKVPNTWTAGHNITHFDGGYSGQVIVVIGGDADCSVIDGNHLTLNGNWNAAAGATLTLVFDGTDWYELCRSAN